MNHYTQIPFWENKKRQRELTDFRELVVNYFKDLEYDYSGDPIVDEVGMKIRSSINKKIDGVGYIINSAGVSTKITHYPAPAVGGHITRIDLIENTFNLRSFGIMSVEVIDQIDKALGVYEANFTSSVIRTFNPFFWLGRLFMWLASLPFKLLAHAGFDVVKIQGTLLGKTLKLISDSVVLFGGVLVILQTLGYVGVLANLKALIDGFLP